MLQSPGDLIGRAIARDHVRQQPGRVDAQTDQEFGGDRVVERVKPPSAVAQGDHVDLPGADETRIRLELLGEFAILLGQFDVREIELADVLAEKGELG